MARWGCTTCGISMLSDYFGDYHTPLTLAKDPHHYTASGLVLWQNFKFETFKFVWRDYKEDTTRILDALKDPKKAVMFQVDNGKHWVVGIRPANWVERFAHKGDYVIADPWTGKKVWAKQVWHNITGAAYWEKKL